MSFDELIVKYCMGRTLSYPYKNNRLDRWVVSRYRISNGNIPFKIKTPNDIDNNFELMRNRCNQKDFGMYASNYCYKNTEMNYFDLTNNGNVIDYIALIDIDNTRDNIELFKEVMRVLIVPKLPKNGTYCLVSGNGHHVRIIGFKSHLHASKYINDKFSIFKIKNIKKALRKNEIDAYTHAILTKMNDEGMHIDLLNDVGRISTVPYSNYKYDKNILCVPFETNEFEDYENNWSDVTSFRLPKKLDIWNRDVDESVISFNKLELEDETKEYTNKFKITGNRKLDEDCLPDCVKKALESEFDDGMHRIIMFIASFLYSIGIKDDVIYEICIQRNETFKTPLIQNKTEQIVSEVLKKGIYCPNCSKIVDCTESRNQYPYLSLGRLDLCRSLKNGNYCFKNHYNPVNVYMTVYQCFSGVSQNI
jgi:hypothetical protein